MTSLQYDITKVILPDLTKFLQNHKTLYNCSHRPDITNHGKYTDIETYSWWSAPLNISVSVQFHPYTEEPVLVFSPAVGGSSQLPWEAGMWETGE